MPITLQSSGTVGVTATSTTLGLTLPTVEANDIGLWHTHAQKSTLTHVYPIGWTSIGTVLNELVSTRTMGISFAYRRMDGTESGSTVRVNHGGPSTAGLMSNITTWRGVSTSILAPFSTQVSTTANSSIYTTEGLNLADTDHVCVYLVSNADDAAAVDAMSSGIGISTRLSSAYNTESALGGGAILAMFYGQALSSGTVQGGVCRMGTAEVWSAFEIALRASTEAPPALFWAPMFTTLGVQ